MSFDVIQRNIVWLQQEAVVVHDAILLGASSVDFDFTISYFDIGCYTQHKPGAEAWARCAFDGIRQLSQRREAVRLRRYRVGFKHQVIGKDNNGAYLIRNTKGIHIQDSQ